MPTLIIKTTHIEKLKALGVYDAWFANLKKQWKDDLSGNLCTAEKLAEYSATGQWSNFVSKSFVFSETPEGWDYWERIKIY